MIFPVRTNESPHDKTNKMTCAPSEDSDQPGHPPILISHRCPHEESLDLGPAQLLQTIGPRADIQRLHNDFNKIKWCVKFSNEWAIFIIAQDVKFKLSIANNWPVFVAIPQYYAHGPPSRFYTSISGKGFIHKCMAKCDTSNRNGYTKVIPS